MQPVRPIVYVIDDDHIALWMFQEFLQGIGAEIRAYNSARAFLEAYHPGPHECLVCDLRMPDMGGLEVQRQLLEKRTCLPIILVSAYPEVHSAVEAIKKGAFDFLEKPFKDNDLVDVVLRAIDSDTRRHASQATQADIAGRMGLLTPREHEVMQRVLAGKFNKVIADELNISMRTVEVHRSRVFEKMGVRSAVELAQLLAPGREGRD